ncbi:MAG: amidophosphoribosyltransferase [Candidatus Kerfeldbacteria bacterium]|nr:amidophosphoribosyltransferase [Candidatus Kerfeldbacteria bacterium]
MCGVLGIYGKLETVIAPELYDGMIALQHRGHDACGMVTYDKTFHTKKGLGLVRDVFHQSTMNRLTGNMGLGFIRYATAGGMSLDDSAPFTVHAPYGISMVFNGNLTNFSKLKQELHKKDLVSLNANSDIEAMLHVFAKELTQHVGEPMPKAIFATVKKVYQRCLGAYAAITIIADHGMVAFRDPRAIRPLMIGQRGRGKNVEYIFTSESVMFTMLGFRYIDDVKPGEAVFVDRQRHLHRRVVTPGQWRPCLFEYVYFARPDAIQNNISVYKARLRMGEKLADRLRPLLPTLKIDVVIPAPSTSNTAALALAQKLGLNYREGLVKNQFIGRTFIMAGNERRKKSVRHKLNPQPLEIRRRNVLLVDDSIVRGNTSREIIKMLREAGARKVYMAAAAPPVISPCVYGVDMPTRQELIANQVNGGGTVEGIRKFIGADFLIYQTIEDLIEAVRIDKGPVREFCTACWTRRYPTPEVNTKMLRQIENERLADANAAHC